MTAKKTAAAPEPKKAADETPKKAKAAKDTPESPAKAAAKKPAAKAEAKVDAKASAAAKPGKAAAKGKPAAKAPKGRTAQAIEDEDVESDGDTESEVDTEVEVEAEVEVVDEKEAKAKPLRMKVSRAKERALMREFGLDETALTEEEATKRRSELKTLIKMGKTRGFLTHQEINDHLPEKLVNEEILEAIISMLNDMGIAVYEQAPDAATLLISGSNTSTATEEEAEEAAEAALSTVDSEFGRTTDPVRMY
ncbi:MAG: RNA polymerase sigma factor RpoD, partial [Rhodoferax sp.]|nr:RNA polymerase sigma factor RpoD [Rhodoferax sp.]